MSTSSYVNIGVIAKDQEFSERVRACIAFLRASDSTPKTGKDAAEQTANDEKWLPFWLWRIAADNSTYSRYWGNTGMNATPPNEHPGTDTSVISDAVLETAVKAVLGIA